MDRTEQHRLLLGEPIGGIFMFHRPGHDVTLGQSPPREDLRQHVDILRGDDAVGGVLPAQHRTGQVGNLVELGAVKHRPPWALRQRKGDGQLGVR